MREKPITPSSSFFKGKGTKGKRTDDAGERERLELDNGREKKERECQ